MTMAGKHDRQRLAADVRSGVAMAAAVLALTASPGPRRALAQEAAAGAAPSAAPNTQQMIDALKPRTRGLRNLIVGEAAASAAAGDVGSSATPADPASVSGMPHPAASDAALTVPAAPPSLSVRGSPQYGAPHISVSGNREFVPAWFANALAVAPAAATSLPAVPPMAAPAELGAASLRRLLGQIHEQRDSKRSVAVQATRERLRIGTDALGFSVRSSHAGQVYVALLGSDGQTLTLLFPNALDSANSIAAGETLTLPRPNWTLTAGTDTLLVLVTDGPRDFGALPGGRAGPFVQPLTDAHGRAQLPWLLGTNLRQGAGCAGSSCSDAFGSALLSLEEY